MANKKGKERKKEKPKANVNNPRCTHIPNQISSEVGKANKVTTLIGTANLFTGMRWHRFQVIDQNPYKIWSSETKRRPETKLDATF